MRHYSPFRGGTLSVELDLRSRRIELRCERLSLELDPASLELSLAARGGTPRLTGARPRVWLGGRALEAVRARSVETEHVDTPLGPATRVLVCCDAEAGLELGLSLDVGGDWPGAVLQLALQNARAQSVRVGALEVLYWHEARGELELPGPARALRWLDVGAHGGTAASEVRLRRGLRAHTAASLRAPGAAGLTFGFLGWRTHAGSIELGARASGPVELAVRSDLGGAELAPGERALGERAWIGLDGASEDGMAAWAERAGLELEARRHRPVSVWCAGPRADATAALALARELRERELAVDAIRVDAGFAARAGDWLEPSERFPAGLEPLSRELRSLGFALGVRLAPFAASRRSQLARAHPEWLLRGRWRTSLGRMRALDLACEPARAWLESLARGLRERGATHFWLDDLWLGLLPDAAPRGARGSPPRAGRRAETYRRALESLRRGAGPDATLAGMAAPFAASIGALDALQIAAHDAQRRSWWRRRSSAGSLALRAPLAQRIGGAEIADLALDGDADGLRAAAIGAVICGASVCFRGAPERVPEARWRLARRLLPPTALAPLRLPFEGVLAAPGPDGSSLLALLGGAAQAVDLEPLGIRGEARVFDAWRGEDLGIVERALERDRIDSSSAQLLRVSPADGRARLVGSTIHLAGGSAELEALAPEPGGGVRLALALPGRHQGTIHVQVPGTDPALARLRVAFDDRLELRIDSLRVE